MLGLIIILAAVVIISGTFYLHHKSSGWLHALQNAPVLLVHHLSEHPDLAISTIPARKLAGTLAWAQQAGFSFRSLEELTAGYPDSWNPDRLAITFDDGYESAEVFFRAFCESRRIPVAIFVTAGFIGRQAHWDYKPIPPRHLDLIKLRGLADSGLVTVGSHSFSHPDLRSLSGRQLIHEVADSKKLLEDCLGREVSYFSYPFGRFNRRVWDCVAGAGYRAAFCGVPWQRMESPNRLAIPRIPLNLLDNFFTLSLKLKPGCLTWLEYSKSRVIELYSGLTFQVRRNRRDG